MKARALKFVRFDRIEEHLALGWMVMIPNVPMHHHHYGVELKWICGCRVPGGFDRVPVTATQESADNDRAGAQHQRPA
jgi:hypothetical protein